MRIVVINAGSSSLKCTLFAMPQKQALATGTVEKIGEGNSLLHYEGSRGTTTDECEVQDHEQALRLLTRHFAAPDTGVLHRLDEVDAVGHRVVHGGELSGSVLIDEHVTETIRQMAALAPLHNPPNLVGIEAARRLWPGRPQVAVFDTAFHAGMPPHAFLYAVPYSLYTERHVRVYGFHGTSHRYVTHRAAEILGIPVGQMNMITLHLGNGCSAAAVRNGRSIDTSMGMTPLEGLVMGTRCGDVDPALPYFLNVWFGLSPAEVYELLNRRSGLLGLSGVSNDMRQVMAAAEQGNERAALALEVFAYRVRKYIGAYYAVLGRVDAVVFTAGIGERSAPMRSRCCRGLEGLGIMLDEHKNAESDGKEAVISLPDSPVSVLVVPTNEALQIAIETYQTVLGEEPK